MMRLLLLKTCFIAFSQCKSQSSLETQKYFKNVKGHGGSLTSENAISSHTVHSKIECSLKCLQKSTCVGYNYRSKSNKYAVNCQLGNKPQERGGSGEWTFYQDLETLTTGNVRANDISNNASSCKELHILIPQLPNGIINIIIWRHIAICRTKVGLLLHVSQTMILNTGLQMATFGMTE